MGATWKELLNDTTQSFSFDLTRDGELPRLERAPGGGAIVRAYTDFRRHNLCDPEDHPDPIRTFLQRTSSAGTSQPGRTPRDGVLSYPQVMGCRQLRSLRPSRGPHKR